MWNLCARVCHWCANDEAGCAKDVDRCARDVPGVRDGVAMCPVFEGVYQSCALCVPLMCERRGRFMRVVYTGCANGVCVGVPTVCIVFSKVVPVRRLCDWYASGVPDVQDWCAYIPLICYCMRVMFRDYTRGVPDLCEMCATGVWREFQGVCLCCAVGVRGVCDWFARGLRGTWEACVSGV